MKILVACVNMTFENTRRQPWYYMDSIVKGLSEKGHDVWILTDRKTKWSEQRKFIVFENFRSFPRGIDSRLRALIENHGFNVVIWSTGLTDFLFKNKIDVLNIPTIAVVTSPRYFFSELLSLSKDLLVNREFTKQFFLGPLISQRRIRKFLAIANLKAVVFECEQTLVRYIPHKIEREKLYIVPPPLSRNFFDIVSKIEDESADSEKDSFRILYFGPPISLRGVDTVINAMADVRKTVPRAKLVILSRIESNKLLKYEKKLRRIIEKKGLAATVSIISGLLPQHEIINRLLSSNVVCLPFKSVISDVPIVTLEAIAAGIPLITTDVAGVSEFAKYATCYVVPPNDPASISKAIIKMAEKDAKSIRNRSAIEEMMSNNSLESFGTSFDKILSEVI